MNAQLSLSYDPATEGREAWALELEALRSAVNYLTIKEVAFALDVNASTLCDALNERDRKRWAGGWTPVLRAMLRAKRSDEIAQRLLRSIAEAQLSGTEFELAGAAEISADEMQAALAAVASVRAKRKAARR